MFHLNSAECTDRRQQTDHKFRWEPVCWLWGIPPPLPPPSPAWSRGKISGCQRLLASCPADLTSFVFSLSSLRTQSSQCHFITGCPGCRLRPPSSGPLSWISDIIFEVCFIFSGDARPFFGNMQQFCLMIKIATVSSFYLGRMYKTELRRFAVSHHSAGAEVLADWNNPNQPGRLLARGNTRRNANPSFENH